MKKQKELCATPCKDCAEVIEKQKKRIKRLERLLETERLLSGTDKLTGLANRRTFDDRLAHAVARVSRRKTSGEVFSLAILDVDHFKAVNDTYGHSSGDEVLSMLGKVLRGECRAADEIARIGGEEFALILNLEPIEKAKLNLERIRRRVESEIWLGGSTRITISIGVAEATYGESAENLLTRADKALYTAKKTGRNKVVAE